MSDTEPKMTQEELRKAYGLPKRSWRSYFGHPEPELPQPNALPEPLETSNADAEGVLPQS